jgi:hypothetical protein
VGVSLTVERLQKKCAKGIDSQEDFVACQLKKALLLTGQQLPVRRFKHFV